MRVRPRNVTSGNSMADVKHDDVVERNAISRAVASASDTQQRWMVTMVYHNRKSSLRQTVWVLLDTEAGGEKL